MKNGMKHIRVVLAWLTLLIFNWPLTSAQAQGTAFLYQGRLNATGGPATGSYDLTFTLYATNVTGSTIAGPVTNSATGVSNGLFTVAIDFGPGVFMGNNSWLEVGVRTNGSGSFNTLAPRQPVLPVPYAIFAGSASNLTGTLPLAELPGVVLTNNEGGVNLTGAFTGNAGGLTNISLAAVGPPGTFNLTTQSIGLSGKVTVGNGPKRVVAADFNGDGLMDLASANITDGTVSVVTNSGNGIFIPATTVIAGNPNKVVSVVAADFNGDGKMDLAVANYTDNNVIVFTNAGNATFAPMWTNLFTYYPYYLMAGDFNGDGRTDYAATMVGAPFFAEEFNRGNTNFFSTGLISANYSQFGVAVDVNGDGSLDVITANYSDKTVTVNTNNGQGTFFQSSTPALASGPYSMGVGDFYGTGRPGLAVACLNNPNIFLLANQGGGIFVSNAAINMGATVAFVTAADMNGDGKPDLICAVGGTSLVILTNDWHGNFSPFVTLNMPNSGSGISILIADVNGDGYPDVVFSDVATNKISIFTNSSPAQLVVGGVLAGNGYGLTNLNLNFAQLSGVILPSQLARGVLTNTETGVTLSNLTVGGSLTLPAAINFGGQAQLNANDNYSSLFLNSGTIISPTYDNTAVGIGALAANYSGSGNTAIGALTLLNSPGGYGDTAVGSAALYYTLAGNYNTAIGGSSLVYNTNGNYNTALGFEALYNNTSGGTNLAIGYAAGNNITNGSGNIDIGASGTADESNTIRLGSSQTQTFIAGVINGNGGGLTNLPAAILPSTVVTNTETGVTLSGIFNGNGGGLTNLSAAQLSGAIPGGVTLPATNLTGTIPTAQLPATVVTNTETGVTLSGAFNGNGGGLTNLSAAQLSGAIPGGVTIPATNLTGTLPTVQLPVTIVTNTETGVTLSGAFNGNGGGLTNLSAAQLNGAIPGGVTMPATNLTGAIPTALLPVTVLTNTETGVTLGGTFSGNGGGLTNVSSGPTTGNYLFSYDTTTQTTTTANTYQDVNFSANAQISGWTHTTSTSSFTVNQSGLYLVEYMGEADVTVSSSVVVSMHLTVNGTEVAGSQAAVGINNSSLYQTCSKSCLVSLTSGEVLKVQLAASSTFGQLTPPATGSGTTKPSASITAVRIQ